MADLVIEVAKAVTGCATRSIRGSSVLGIVGMEMGVVLASLVDP